MLNNIYELIETMAKDRDSQERANKTNNKNQIRWHNKNKRNNTQLKIQAENWQ